MTTSCVLCRTMLSARSVPCPGSGAQARILPTLHAQDSHSAQSQHISRASKRELFFGATLVLTGLQVGGIPAAAFEFLDAKPLSDGVLLDANDFEVIVPTNFVDLGVPKPKKPTGITATPGAPPPPSPVKARYGLPDGSAVVTVVVKESSSIKPTFIQLNDISSWGNGTEVAQILLPKGARIQRFDKTVIPLPPKDTRTVKGIVEVPPLVIYRYLFDAGGDAPVRLAAAAQKGRVYIMAASASLAAASDATTLAGLERALDTFRCKEEFKPLF